MNNILEKLHEINQLVLSGKAIEAFEKHYHDDVVMQENNNQPTVGKQPTTSVNSNFLEVSLTSEAQRY